MFSEVRGGKRAPSIAKDDPLFGVDDKISRHNFALRYQNRTAPPAPRRDLHIHNVIRPCPGCRPFIPGEQAPVASEKPRIRKFLPASVDFSYKPCP
jgi:hypothetical protein